MNTVARTLSRVASRAATRSVNVAKPAVARFSTLLDKKEKGEEGAYFRSKDNENLKAAVDQILAMEDGCDAKEELMEVIGRFIYSII
jgi:hypothetical protein